MKRIDTDTIYTSEEAKELLHGCVKLETLREYGLIALPGAGYWGADLILAINSMQEARRRASSYQATALSPSKAPKAKPRKAPNQSQPAESQREKLRRLMRERLDSE